MVGSRIMKFNLSHPIILFVTLGVGVTAAVIMVKSRPIITHGDLALEPRYTKFLSIKRQPFISRVTAYGNVEPGVSLESKSEVAGMVSYVHPDLNPGAIIAGGTVVIRVNPEDYQVTLEQKRAELSANRSSLKQLQTEEDSMQRSLLLARENLVVGEKELQRLTNLLNKQLVSRSAVDTEAQKVIKLRQQVEDLQGKLNTYVSQKASIEAQITSAEQQVKGQATALGRTEISLPFDARISAVEVEIGEFVQVGGMLFEAFNLDSVEIKAELPLNQVRSLFSSMHGRELSLDAGNAAKVFESFNLKANVRLIGLNLSKGVWEGQVARFSESIDPVRRTFAIIVVVRKPYESLIMGERPPLLKGMFVAVDLYSPEREAIVIPRRAVHEGRVYLIDDMQKLEIRPIQIQLQQNDQIVVSEGLKEGERLIVNDLIPVIPGMPLEGTELSDQKHVTDKDSIKADAVKPEPTTEKTGETHIQ